MTRILLAVLLSLSTMAIAETAPIVSFPPCDDRIISMEGEFDQSRYISVLEVPLLSSGRFRYHWEAGLVWQTTSPVENAIHITAENGLVQLDAKGTPDRIPGTQVISNIFLGIFSCRYDELGETFSIITETENDQWKMRLTPTRPAVAEHVEVIIVTGDEHIHQVEIIEANSDRRVLIFKNVKTVQESN